VSETTTQTGRIQIGTVEITRSRIYPLDPWLPEHVKETAAQVVVQPGIYPVYRDGLSHYWRMTGVLNHRHYRMGDGIFALSTGDVPSDDDVVFYSMRYGPDEWAELLNGYDTDPDPRLILTLNCDCDLCDPPKKGS
jgi:hypothetical protein